VSTDFIVPILFHHPKSVCSFPLLGYFVGFTFSDEFQTQNTFKFMKFDPFRGLITIIDVLEQSGI